MATKPVITHSIIWADDDPDDVMLFREVLEASGSEHHIIEMSNGVEVINFLASVSGPEQLPCLIILDNNMPGLSGRETLLKIRSKAKFSHIPIVIFTTSVTDRDRALCDRLDAFIYAKPHTFDNYAAVISQLISHCSKPLENAA